MLVKARRPSSAGFGPLLMICRVIQATPERQHDRSRKRRLKNDAYSHTTQHLLSELLYMSS